MMKMDTKSMFIHVGGNEFHHLELNFCPWFLNHVDKFCIELYREEQSPHQNEPKNCMSTHASQFLFVASVLKH